MLPSKIIDKGFLIKKSMFIAAALSCLIALIFDCVAMATDNWIVSQACNVEQNGACDTDTMNVNYGLFGGSKEFGLIFGKTLYELNVYCSAGDGVCLVSCGRNADEEKLEYQWLKYNTKKFNCVPIPQAEFHGTSDDAISSTIIGTTSVLADEMHGNEQFMNYSAWVSTVVFLSFTIALQIVAGGICILNIVTVPVEMWTGPLGIYLTNGGAALFNLITLAVWGDLFNRNLHHSLAIQETIISTWVAFSTNLGYSYWFIFISMIFNGVSCLFIRFRKVVNDPTTMNDNQTEGPTPTGNILLY